MLRLVVYLVLSFLSFFAAFSSLRHAAEARTPSPDAEISIQRGEGPYQGMVRVPAGSFLMGSNNAPDQSPPRRLWLDAFWIDENEVSAGDLDRFLKEMGLGDPGAPLWDPHGRLKSEYASHPAYPAPWKQARDYCRSAGKRLPTETEWEKAARGPAGRTYPWGNRWDDHLSNSAALNIWREFKSRPVGSFPEGAAPYGALDMAGNVREWVADVYEPDRYSNTRFMIRPTWISPPHVLRGGSFAGSHQTHSGSHRSHGDINPERRDYGFRCAKDD